MEVKKFYHKKLYLRFCVSPRYASDVTKLVIYCLSNWFSFSFSHHGVHKKGNLFQTFLFLIKKTPFLNFPLSYKKDPHTMKKIENRNVSFPVAFFFKFAPATDPKAWVLIFATDLATFALARVDDPSFFPWGRN